MTTLLIGKQIILRDWLITDLDGYAQWLQPGQTWQQTDGPYEPAPTMDEIATQLDRLQQQISSREFPTPRRHLVIADRQTNELRGRVNAYWEQQTSRSINMGIALYDPATWGHGLGYEALGLWTDYLFTALPQIVRLGLRTWSGNGGMMRLATKLGFREEMRLRKARLVDGEWFDGMGYGILRTEWQARYPQGFR